MLMPTKNYDSFSSASEHITLQNKNIASHHSVWSGVNQKLLIALRLTVIGYCLRLMAVMQLRDFNLIPLAQLNYHQLQCFWWRLRYIRRWQNPRRYRGDQSPPSQLVEKFHSPWASTSRANWTVTVVKMAEAKHSSWGVMHEEYHEMRTNNSTTIPLIHVNWNHKYLHFIFTFIQFTLITVITSYDGGYFHFSFPVFIVQGN